MKSTSKNMLRLLSGLMLVLVMAAGAAIAQQPTPTPRPTPQNFKSKDLSENDVRRILEELKRQEQEIRAKQYKENKNTPESQIEKDW